MLQSADVASCLVERVTGTGVQPAHAPVHGHHLQLTIPQVLGIEVRDLQLTSR